MSSAPDDRSGVRIFPPLIYLGGLFLGFLIHWRLPLPIIPAVLVGPLRLLGAFCLVAGLALTIWAVATFRRVGTTRHPAGPTTALAVAGPYRFTRNPMYLGLVFITAGLALLANALWPLVLLPVVIVILRRAVIDREERYLTAKFGEEYLQYKARVERNLTVDPSLARGLFSLVPTCCRLCRSFRL